MLLSQKEDMQGRPDELGDWLSGYMGADELALQRAL